MLVLALPKANPRPCRVLTKLVSLVLALPKASLVLALPKASLVLAMAKTSLVLAMAKVNLPEVLLEQDSRGEQGKEEFSN